MQSRLYGITENPVTINFDLGALKLPAHESNRKLKNMAIF